jgi:murein DD-endopeptidase MepM/ murein hydrolase activator NlpD
MSVDQIQLELPVGGIESKDWVVNYFVAHPDRDQFRDYRGGRKTYPLQIDDERRHTGTDFNVPNFRWMDSGFPVYASADGEVICVHDGESDRNTCRRSPGGLGNSVEIEHSNEFSSRYGHLKRGSILVEQGQQVVAGERIGAIGSSGSSDGPHLHFELLDRDGNIVDPCQEGYWISPPKYCPPFAIMDFGVQHGSIGSLSESKTPPRRNVRSVRSGECIGVSVFIAGLKPNEEIAIVGQVGSEAAVGICRFSEDEIQNFVIARADLDFPEAGTGVLAFYKDRTFLCGHKIEVQRAL